MVQEKPKSQGARLSAIPAAKGETKSKQKARKDKSSDKNIQIKGKRKAKQAKALNQDINNLPPKTETKDKESPTSSKAREKEVKSD
ncbi:Non-histone chromosomal protein HMG-14 [Sciurus carolinensis]|uniref:Non-histone chromosomal protein HMG-14 n=1 Tax=Sciurus carolinensis TaxID=30640 RepID=A0AA41MKL5_SCICA|nr:Non-histone chromosomal protein HMG-14 [Sciurus carolinensis]